MLNSIKNKYSTSEPHSKGNSLKKVFAGLAIVLVAGVVVGGLWYLKSNHRNTSTTGRSSDGGYINLNPATEQDKQEVNQHKADLPSQSQADTPAPSSKSVTPVIVDAGQYDQQIEVRSYVSGIFESNGTCTITFTKDTKKIVKTVAGQQDATTTRCSNVTVPRSEFPVSGTWNVTVSYTSSTSQGTSQAHQFEVK